MGLQRFVKKNIRRAKIGKKGTNIRNSESLPAKIHSTCSSEPYSHSKSKASTLDTFFVFSGSGDNSDNESQINVEKNSPVSDSNHKNWGQPIASRDVSFIANNDVGTDFVSDSILEEDIDAMKIGTMATNW